MLWIVGIAVIFILTGGAVAFTLFRKVGAQKEIVLLNLKILQTEFEDKRKVLEELAVISLGLIPISARDELRAQLGADEDALRGEKGKATILQAEMEAVDIRLRELEEIERELESSGVEAAREMELLRTQQRDLESRNTKLSEMLESSAIQIDRFLQESKGDPELQEALKKAKSDLNTGQSKLRHFETEIPKINEKYMGLKKAYDALDIEYAQLYEKQSQVAAAT